VPKCPSRDQENPKIKKKKTYFDAIKNERKKDKEKI